MKARFGLFLVLAAVFLAGCATRPQVPVALRSEAVSPGAGRVGVAMVQLPNVDTHLPGASCLLCLAAASVANSALTAHAKTLPHDDLPQIKGQFAELLRKKGANVVLIEEDIKLDALNKFNATGPNLATKDFTPLKAKYQLDKLLLVEIQTLGFWRTYSAYVPTSDPKATLQGLGYLVNLKDNSYEWYQPVSIMKSAEGKWDEPPKFPGLTNAYFQAVELGKDGLLQAFK